MITINELERGLASMIEAFREFGHVVVRCAADVASLWGVVRDDVIIHEAVECRGIAESDIRDVHWHLDRVDVRLWNHRRVTVREFG